MDSILRICVLSTLRVVTQHTEVLTVNIRRRFGYSVVFVRLSLLRFHFFFFFFFFCCSIHFKGQWLLFIHYSWTVAATFDYFNIQISFFINFFIKNGSHDTIHTFKNYFVIVFSVFNNKQYPNINLVSVWYCCRK